MTITNPAMANLDKHGAQLIDNGAEGFTVKAASGAQLGVLAYPDEPWLFDHANPVSAPKATWAAQKSIEVYCEYDAEKLKLDQNDTISDIERTRRELKLKQKINDAQAHIETELTKDEADLQVREDQFHEVTPLQSDDLVGAFKGYEIRTLVHGMTNAEQGPIIDSLIAGDNRQLLLAVLQAPLGMGRLSSIALDGWKSLRDREEPQRRAGFDLHKSRNDWGRRIVNAAQGALSARLRAN